MAKDTFTVWCRLTIDYLANLLASMPQSMELVIQAEGGSINYKHMSDVFIRISFG
jgi:hypothetical protein